MKNLVVMPTLRRPEFLALSLEKLHSSGAYNAAEVNIYLDTCGPEVLEEVNYVRDMYYPAASIFQANEHPQAPSGCWNILNSLKDAHKLNAEFTFLVEEDVLINKNFFEWHLKIQENSDVFVSCGRLIPRYGINHYTNPGSCFKKTSLDLIVPHINNEFFQDRRVYVDKTFGPMDEASDLDDGLIRRVIRSNSGKIAFPPTPVAFHQGFRTYNLFHQYKNEGDIKQRIENLREILARLNPESRYEKDFEPFQEA